mmetsp:Transcript_4361/g.4516  ORF Transcript_4361/g.4516 Transcript_4361/m.4516 type:complete len:268 (+) Transcript_4361:1-804(+)
MKSFLLCVLIVSNLVFYTKASSCEEDQISKLHQCEIFEFDNVKRCKECYVPALYGIMSCGVFDDENIKNLSNRLESQECSSSNDFFFFLKEFFNGLLLPCNDPNYSQAIGKGMLYLVERELDIKGALERVGSGFKNLPKLQSFNSLNRTGEVKNIVSLRFLEDKCKLDETWAQQATSAFSSFVEFLSYFKGFSFESQIGVVISGLEKTRDVLCLLVEGSIPDLWLDLIKMANSALDCSLQTDKSSCFKAGVDVKHFALQIVGLNDLC